MVETIIIFITTTVNCSILGYTVTTARITVRLINGRRNVCCIEDMLTPITHTTFPSLMSSFWQVPNDGRYMGAHTHYSGTCPACTVPGIYRTIRVLNPDVSTVLMMCGDSEFSLAVACHYPYGTKCHSLHQYVLEYSCEKASADRSRKSNSATAPRPGWESSLFHTQGLAAIELAFC